MEPLPVSLDDVEQVAERIKAFAYRARPRKDVNKTLPKDELCFSLKILATLVA